MTTITTTCAGCGRALAVPERFQGRSLKCPSCGRAFRAEVPKPSPPAEPIAPSTATVATTRGPQATPIASPVAPSPAEPFGDVVAPASEAETGDALATGPVYWRVKRVGVLSVGLMSALINALVGLLVSLAALLIPFVRTVALGRFHGALGRAIFLLALPVLNGAVGFIAGVVAAALYNLAARWAGGVRVLLE